MIPRHGQPNGAAQAAAEGINAGAALGAKLASTVALRAELWDAGYRPVAIYNTDAPIESPGKAPIGREWQQRARRDPPVAAVLPVVAAARNTGILCDGLRAVDVDVDDRDLAARLRALAIQMLGEAPMRYRDNSGRCLLVYAAASGEPPKRVLVGEHGKVEVLGRGQQFVAHGRHPFGAELHWTELLASRPRDTLSRVTEDDVGRFLAACALLIGANPDPKPDDAQTDEGDGATHRTSDFGPSADLQDVNAALAAIPNNGPPHWDNWNHIAWRTHRLPDSTALGVC